MAGMFRTVALAGFIGVAGTLSFAAPAAAQGPSLAQATAKVGPSQKVLVTTVAGVEWRGPLLSVSDDAISIPGARGPVSLARNEIRRIEVNDGIRDGVLRGAVIGGLGGAVPAAIFVARYGECPCEGSMNLIVAFGALGAGIGTAIGAASDALITHRQTLYDAPAAFSIAPVVAPGRVAVGASVRW